MIGYLSGKILEHADGRIVLLTGSGVGYLASVPTSPAYISFNPGETVELFVHTHVREEALDLYGFATRVEKDLFLTLLTVNGIGPKGALGLLSKINAGDLVRAILEGDKDALTQIPGIGKKTAERVVLELGDSLRKKVEAGAFGTLAMGSRASGATFRDRGANAAVAKYGTNRAFIDAHEALVGLGYKDPEIAALLNRVMESTPQATTTEDIIRAALARSA